MRSREDIQAARRYMHMRTFMECGVGLICWHCAWRTVTGGHDRARRRYIERSRRVMATLEPVPYVWTDERRLQFLERGIDRITRLVGGSTCTQPHDHEHCDSCRASV